MVGTIHACGDFTALFMIGVISDRFGRRWMLVATATSCAVAGVARSFATSYIAYVVYEYLDAMLGAGVYSTGYILALEMVGPRKRVLCGSIIAAMFALGQVVLALMAWAVPYWRHLTRLIYGPCFLFLFYYFLIEESIRWLITKGKKEEATKILLKVAKCNNTQISQDTIKRLVNLEKLPQEDKRLSLLCKVLHSRILMSRVLICSFVWITVTFTYYGLSINSVSLAGNMYVNYILTALVEIPGCALSVYTMDRFGRRATIMASLFICGASLFVLPVIPNTRAGVQLALSLVGKVGASAASSGMHVYTTELFPTSARHRALAACSTVARLGQAVAMMTPLLMKVHFWLPYLLFAALSVTAGLLLLLTPETQQRLLPDTVEQAERLSDTPKTGRRSPMVDLEKDRIPDK